MTRQGFTERLRKAAPFAALTEPQAHVLWQHFELLRRWNARINLTRVVDMEAAVRFHYAESLFVAERLPKAARTVVDVGSGAGFPGFVLAVARPELRVTLLEADKRKAAFLREASDWAPNVQVEARRCSELQGCWDVVVSRAVRAEDVLEFAARAGRWVLLVGTAPAAATSGWQWRADELPDGRGKLWLAELPRQDGRA